MPKYTTANRDEKVKIGKLLCPCGSTNLTGPKIKNHVWNDHYECADCKTVLFSNHSADTPTSPLNYCGNPKQHWGDAS